MTQEFIKATGQVFIQLHDKFGDLKDERHVPNLVVNVGKEYITSRMVGTSYPVIGYMGIGTSSTAASAGQTDLVAPVTNTDTGAVRLALTGGGGTIITGTVDTTIQYVATFSSYWEGGIYEAGLFNALTGGTMLCRTTFNQISKASEDTLTINWNVTIS